MIKFIKIISRKYSEQQNQKMAKQKLLKVEAAVI